MSGYKLGLANFLLHHGQYLKCSRLATGRSVIVACSLNPVVADLKGLVRLSNALTHGGETITIMQNLGSHNQQVIQIVSEAVDDNLVAQKQISNAYIGICNALAQQLRLSVFGW
jgi:hypothetical protein